MSSRRMSLASAVLLVLSTRAILLPGEGAPPKTPGFSYDAPAVGLKGICTLGRQEFIAGQQRIYARFTITNATGAVKPITWSTWLPPNFFLAEGQTLQGLGISWRGCSAYPLIREPVLIKSAKEGQRQYVLYLPPGASLTFSVRLSQADAPEQFKGYLLFDPLPASSVTHFWRKESIQDRFVCSQLIEYLVREKSRSSPRSP